jgi:murein DD-endopeptidase MepM/ murein hydrolase activator NlpD
MRSHGPGSSDDLLTLMLVPGRSGTIRRFSVQRRKLQQAVVGGAALLAAMALLSVDYVRVRLAVGDLDDVRAETLEQREQIDAYARRIEEISEGLARVRRFDHKLRVITNLDPGDALPLPGIGGIEGEGLDRHHLSGLTRAQRHRRMLEALDGIERTSVEQQGSLGELLRHLETQTARLGQTPSIAPTKGWITSDFGYRLSPFTQKRELHRGIDIAGRVGTPIVAPADGVVRYTGPDRALGQSVILRHGYGVETLFGHLSEVTVKPGERVARNAQIGLMGSTGRSTGPHLHYQVNVNGTAVDPRNYMLD